MKNLNAIILGALMSFSLSSVAIIENNHHERKKQQHHQKQQHKKSTKHENYVPQEDGLQPDDNGD